MVGRRLLCWHYWLSGKQLLERPFNEVWQSGHPDFPFCLGWANHTWKKVWNNRASDNAVDQVYPEIDDHLSHFKCFLKIFEDLRYITVKRRPLLFVYNPREIPEIHRVTDMLYVMKINIPWIYPIGTTRQGMV